VTALAIVVVAAAFGSTLWAGKRSLGAGLVVLFVWGYLFGILRANLATVFSHFLFDAALLGLYLGQKKAFSDPKDARRTATLRMWVAVLMLWPALLILMPFQPLLISLVGFRGCVFFLPLAVLGSRLRDSDNVKLCNGLTCLNLVALGFGVAEYFQGIEPFYPVNSVTIIMYVSKDVAGGYFRIPGIFSSAHAYGGTMVASIPYLVGAWSQAQTRRSSVFALIGIGTAFAGVLMSATRVNFVMAVIMVLVTIWFGRMKSSHRILFAVLIIGMAGMALNNERFQRFKSLGDTDSVEERISGSVNRGFFEILMEYPIGNGLGGGGTSMPYFLQNQVRNPIGMENEFARILCEQGVIGLMLWLGFLGWFISRAPQVFAKGPWGTGRRMVWAMAILIFATGAIGTGVLTAIPGTAMLLLGMGWTSVPMRAEEGGPMRFLRLAKAGARPAQPLALYPMPATRPIQHS